MVYIAIVLILIVSALLVVAILIQNPKGGGLSAGFGGVGNQVMGARRANDFIEKATWSLVAALLVLSIFSGVLVKRGGAVESTDALNDKIKQSAGVPAPTTPAPGAGGPTTVAPAPAGTPAATGNTVPAQ